jgi:hypothetical protein
VTGGQAWAQVGDLNPNDPGKVFPDPYPPAYQSLNASQNPVDPDTKNTKKVSLKPENIGKNTVGFVPAKNLNASLEKSKKKNNQPGSEKLDPMQINLSLGVGNLHADSVSKSFLDGYFLKSLHEDKSEKKEGKGDKFTVDNVQKIKNRSSFMLMK